MKQINFLKTRSFWATVGAVATGLEQAGGGDPAFPGILSAVGTLLQVTGLIPDAADFTTSVGPLVTAGLGLWAYYERLTGVKKVVMGKAEE